jgi:hypothetical protein
MLCSPYFKIDRPDPGKPPHAATIIGRPGPCGLFKVGNQNKFYGVSKKRDDKLLDAPWALTIPAAGSSARCSRGPANLEPAAAAY